MEGEQAVEIFNLVKQQGMLPQKLNDLVPLSFIGQAAVSFYRQKIKLMDQLKMTEAQRKATLKDGQDAGEMLLDIETRIGELLPNREKAMTAKVVSRDHLGRMTKTEKLFPLPEGLSHKRAQHARSIKEHPEIVEKVKAQARENEDIPTRTAVINEIRYQKERERQRESKNKIAEWRPQISSDQEKYILALERFVSGLPKEPPKKWNDYAFNYAKGLAQIIIKRLEVFNG